MSKWRSGGTVRGALQPLFFAAMILIPGQLLCFAQGSSLVQDPNLKASIAVTNRGRVRLQWPSADGNSYQVQLKTDLSLTNWSNLTDLLVATSALTSVEYDAQTNPQGFYRIALVGVTLLQDDFDGGYADQWRLEPGWQVEQEAGNYMLSGEGHAWANLLMRYAWNDFRLRIRVKIVTGAIHLNYRITPQGRYFISFDTSGTWLHKQYFPDTFFHGLGSSSISNTAGVWHTVEIVGRGSNLKVLVDGVQRIDYTDPEPLLKGSIAFETLDDSHVHVAEVTVTGPPVVPDPCFTWVRTGGPLGGIGYDVRIDPTDPQVVYVTDAWSGVSKSVDGGTSWVPINKGITSRTGSSGDRIPVFCLTIDPRNPQVLWIGTLGIRGVYKSLDGGLRWQKCDQGIPDLPDITFRSFTIDPLNSDIVYVGFDYRASTIGPDGQYERAGKLYKTTDGGQNWTQVLDAGALVRWMAIDPTDTRILYVATGIFDRDDVRSEGILKSTDRGATWRNINNGLPNLTVGGLVMDPRNSQVLYAATGRHDGFGGGPTAAFGGVYKTTNGGEMWIEVLHGPSDRFPVTAITLAPSNPDIVYVAPTGNTFYRSQDGGRTWQSFDMNPEGINESIPVAVTADPTGANVVYINSYLGGVFKSTDGGQTWYIASCGYTGAQTRDVGMDPQDPAVVYVTGRQGVAMSQVAGQRWTYVNPREVDKCDASLSVNPNNPRDLLAASGFYGRILRTTNGGTTWHTVLEPIPNSSYPNNLHGAVHFARFRGNPNLIYAAGRMAGETMEVNRFTRSLGVLKSTDAGEHWQAKTNGLIADLNINAVAIHPTDPNIAYAGTLNGGVYRTTDGGVQWGAIGGNFATDVRSLAIDATNPNLIYAGAEMNGLFRSTDAGQTWQRMGAGLEPNASVRSIVIDPTRSAVLWAADIFSGVYRSTDGGTNWEAFNDGLSTRAVNALAISADGQVLYAATEGEGVFRLGVIPWATVSGIVRDANGPVPGAIVRVQSTTKETLTDAEGRFSLTGLREGVPVTLSAWKHAYYCAKVDQVVPSAATILITLRPCQMNDNPSYQWIPPVGANSCMSCKAGVTKIWLDNDAHAGAAKNPRFLTMYNGTDFQGRQSPLTSYTFNRDYGRIPLPPDRTKPYYGPGYKLDFSGTAGNCAACHTPGAAVDAPYSTNPNSVTGADEFGVHCDFCHKVADVTLNPATGLPAPNHPGVLSMDIRRPFPEDRDRYQLFFGTFDDDNVPQEDTYLPLLKESKFCAPCHFGTFWNMVIYNSFGEWLDSPYSDPTRGKTCQACHMPVPSILDGKIMTNVAPGTGGVERDPLTIHAHTFPGAMNQELLQNAVTMNAAAHVEANKVVVLISITNDKTGHHVPTDSPLRHLILLVSATDTNGQSLSQLDGPTVPDWGGVGDPAKGYYAGLPGKAFAKVLEELWTEVSPTGAYWNPTRVLSDNRLAAFAADRSRYTFAAPSEGRTAVEVKLLFRRAFKTLIDQKAWDVPDIVMAKENIILP